MIYIAIVFNKSTYDREGSEVITTHRELHAFATEGEASDFRGEHRLKTMSHEIIGYNWQYVYLKDSKNEALEIIRLPRDKGESHPYLIHLIDKDGHFNSIRMPANSTLYATRSGVDLRYVQAKDLKVGDSVEVQWDGKLKVETIRGIQRLQLFWDEDDQ